MSAAEAATTPATTVSLSPHHVLFVGSVYKDIILTVPRYPQEDDKLRATSRSVRRGGNNANSACVLGQHLTTCSFMGAFNTEQDADFALQDLTKHGVCWKPSCFLGSHYAMPEAIILQSDATHSRTIVNYRDLPGVSLDNFKQGLTRLPCTISELQWIHLEGSFVEDALAIIDYIRTELPHHLRISVEVEKAHREGIDNLIPAADVVLFSKAYAHGRGYVGRPQEFLKDMATKARADSSLYVGWGEDGAAGYHRGMYHFEPALRIQVCETIGAGDTFNAAVIYAHLRMEERFRGVDWKEEQLQHVLRFACALAGTKCAQFGFDMPQLEKLYLQSESVNLEENHKLL